MVVQGENVEIIIEGGFFYLKKIETNVGLKISNLTMETNFLFNKN
jgi:hypothetical protein